MPQERYDSADNHSAGGPSFRPAGFPSAGGLPLEGKLSEAAQRGAKTDEVSTLRTNKVLNWLCHNTSSVRLRLPPSPLGEGLKLSLPRRGGGLPYARGLPLEGKLSERPEGA